MMKWKIILLSLKDQQKFILSFNSPIYGNENIVMTFPRCNDIVVYQNLYHGVILGKGIAMHIRSSVEYYTYCTRSNKHIKRTSHIATAISVALNL